jgi:2-polyprenyl-3-methyl-5-hydroxy-6-metoxy-1,4-benzoquinol methylase
MQTDQQLVDLQETLYTSRNPTRRWLHCTRRDWIVSQILSMPNTIGTALEVGPGAGGYLPTLAEVAPKLVAADIEEAYLSQARTLTETIPGLSCVKDDITATTLEPASFDLVLCTEVIEHIANSQAALCGLEKLLKPDGTLILSTPQRYSPLELCAKVAFLPGIVQLVRLIYREPIIETGHINLLTESALKEQLDEAGLHIQAQFKSGFYLPLVAELFGESGQRLLQWFEKKLRGSRLSWLLWTQYYILRKKA